MCTFFIQIIRNLTYEEQKYVYEQLGEMFRERQLAHWLKAES
jgi:hypothetical protein